MVGDKDRFTVATAAEDIKKADGTGIHSANE